MSWSWMHDSHPFHSMSISHPIPHTKLFQTLTLKLQGQGHGCGQRAFIQLQLAQYHINSLPFHFTSIRPTIPEIVISKFDFETSKVKVISEVKGQGHILYPVPNRCTSFSFHINQTNHSWDIAEIVFDLEKTHSEFLKKICQNKSFQCFVVIRWVVLTLSGRQANFS